MHHALSHLPSAVGGPLSHCRRVPPPGRNKAAPPPCRLRAASSSSTDAEKTCSIEVYDPSGAALTSYTVESGEILRRSLLDAKVELYQGMWAKAMNCGGGGNCGTCAVEVLDEPTATLSPRTANEEKKLKGKPSSWRLACQTIVGSGEDSGTCKVKLGPK